MFTTVGSHCIFIKRKKGRKGCLGRERRITKVNEMETRKAIIEEKKMSLAIVVYCFRATASHFLDEGERNGTILYFVYANEHLHSF